MEQVDAKYRNVPLQNFKGYEEGTRRLANLAEPLRKPGPTARGARP